MHRNFFGKQREKDILFIEIGKRNKRFGSFQTFLQKKSTVSSVAVDNGCFRKLITEKFTAGGILFYDFYMDTGIDQSFCKIIGYRSPTYDQSIFYLICAETYFLKNRAVF